MSTMTTCWFIVNTLCALTPSSLAVHGCTYPWLFVTSHFQKELSWRRITCVGIYMIPPWEVTKAVNWHRTRWMRLMLKWVKWNPFVIRHVRTCRIGLWMPKWKFSDFVSSAAINCTALRPLQCVVLQPFLVCDVKFLLFFLHFNWLCSVLPPAG